MRCNPVRPHKAWDKHRKTEKKHQLEMLWDIVIKSHASVGQVKERCMTSVVGTVKVWTLWHQVLIMSCLLCSFILLQWCEQCAVIKHICILLQKYRYCYCHQFDLILIRKENSYISWETYFMFILFWFLIFFFKITKSWLTIQQFMLTFAVA